MNNLDRKIRDAADSAIILLISRISTPLLVAVCSWIGITVVNLKSDLSGLSASMTATYAGINNEVDDLKSRLNNIEASYFGHPTNQHN